MVGAKCMCDAWDYMIKQEKEGEFLTCVCACVCGYVLMHICIYKPVNALLCQKV